MVNDDGTFGFSDVQLESINGKFYFETSRNKHRVYEVTHDEFRVMLVLVALRENNGLKTKSNSLDYLMNQLVVNEDLFAAMMYDNSQWRL
jgi:hypothetical protein